jgi:hypothetical protein
MSWLDFFRTKRETRKLKFQNLNLEVDAEIQDAKRRIKSIKEQIRQRIVQLNTELEEHIKMLKSIDLRERKDYERIKFIVTENLKAYIFHLQNLREELGNLNPSDSDYLEKINIISENFKKRSINSFQKATILIGKELEDVVNSIKNFAKDVDRIISEDQEAFETEKRTDILKNLLLEFKNEEDNEAQIENSIKSLEQNLKDLEEQKGRTERSLEDSKKSPEYSEFIEGREELKNEREKVQREIFSIKEEIDIKAMLKQFHHDRKKSIILNKYAEDFNAALENDEDLNITTIIREAKPEFNTGRLKELRLKSIELKKWQEKPIETQVKKMENAIKKLDVEISEMQSSIIDERKKEERLEKKTDEMKEEIKKQARIVWENIEIYE